MFNVLASACCSSGCEWPFFDSPLYTSGGDSLTISELMEEQRLLGRSSDPAERLAAPLLIPGVLRERLRELGDFALGQVLDFEVCSNLSVLAPELTVCMEAASPKHAIELRKRKDRADIGDASETEGSLG